MGNMSRKAAERFLLNDGENRILDGSFIVRNSSSDKSLTENFALSVRFENKVQHYKIMKSTDRKYLLWVLPFDSINELIKFYVGHTINEKRVHSKQLRLY